MADEEHKADIVYGFPKTRLVPISPPTEDMIGEMNLIVGSPTEPVVGFFHDADKDQWFAEVRDDEE